MTLKIGIFDGYKDNKVTQEEVEWESALSVANLWFLFGKGDEYLGLLNDETMQFEPKMQ